MLKNVYESLNVQKSKNFQKIRIVSKIYLFSKNLKWLKIRNVPNINLFSKNLKLLKKSEIFSKNYQKSIFFLQKSKFFQKSKTIKKNFCPFFSSSNNPIFSTHLNFQSRKCLQHLPLSVRDNRCAPQDNRCAPQDNRCAPVTLSDFHSVMVSGRPT